MIYRGSCQGPQTASLSQQLRCTQLPGLYGQIWAAQVGVCCATLMSCNDYLIGV